MVDGEYVNSKSEGAPAQQIFILSCLGAWTTFQPIEGSIVARDNQETQFHRLTQVCYDVSTEYQLSGPCYVQKGR